MYANATGAGSIGSDNIGFPGYNPFTPCNAGAFGGPQNLIQLYQDMSYTRGKHSFRFGGAYDYQRDNRTYTAYQTAVDALQGRPGSGSQRPVERQLYRHQSRRESAGQIPLPRGSDELPGRPACHWT